MDWDKLCIEFSIMLPGTTPTYWDDNLTVPMIYTYIERFEQSPSLYTINVIQAMGLGYKPKPITFTKPKTGNAIPTEKELFAFVQEMNEGIPGGRAF